MERIKMVADEIPGYDYGSPNIAKSPITVQEFEVLKESATFGKENEPWLRVAGEVLADQTKALVEKWRGLGVLVCTKICQLSNRVFLTSNLKNT
jgi:hypothetical protein